MACVIEFVFHVPSGRGQKKNYEKSVALHLQLQTFDRKKQTPQEDCITSKTIQKSYVISRNKNSRDFCRPVIELSKNSFDLTNSMREFNRNPVFILKTI